MDFNTITAVATTVASIATATGVVVAAWQISLSRSLAQISFEDSLDQQYRELSKGIPVEALIGKEVSEAKKLETRELIYNYLDLCNEQVYLRARNRISKATWIDWLSGMKANLQKVEFKRVWEEVKSEAPGTFTSLEKLESKRFSSDPKCWS